MKTGKAVGPSGIAMEMIKASGTVGAQLIADLANSIIKAGQIPKQWEESFIKEKEMQWKEVTIED